MRQHSIAIHWIVPNAIISPSFPNAIPLVQPHAECNRLVLQVPVACSGSQSTRDARSCSNIHCNGIIGQSDIYLLSSLDGVINRAMKVVPIGLGIRGILISIRQLRLKSKTAFQVTLNIPLGGMRRYITSHVIQICEFNS